ncbi:ATG C terminal domain-containing protein [Paraphysoderma sedebokerense]|nr:ATG C terminal domain-containing protein [Paraphysoderma sedebokerense]
MRSSVGEIGPKSEMEITNRDLVFDVCADSFVSLKDLLNLYLDELRLSGTSVTEDFTTEPTTDRESQNTQEFVYNDVLGSLDEDAFKAPEPPESLSSSKSDELLSMTIVEDFYNVGSSFANLDIHPPIRDDGDDSSVEVDELEKNNEEVEESINVLDTTGFQIVDDHFVVVTKPDDSDGSDELSYPKHISRVRFKDCNLILRLYEGYDWEITRQSQFDSSGSSPNSFTQTPSSPSTNDYLGHSPSSSSSYSSRADPLKQFYRSSSSKVDIKIKGLSLTYDEYPSDTQVASRLILKVKEFEVLDNIQSSSWKKFCSQLRDEYENMTRESKNVMVKLEMVGVRPNLVSPAVEYRLKLRVTPLKLHVDQDALNMLITFFTFTPPVSTDTRPSDDDMYFQLVEIQPITTRIDYKPKHVDYGQLKSGNLIELLNFFHLEGAEMNLREVKVTGIQGWTRLIEEITSTWLPHITKTQVPNVVSGVGPVRSIRNIGAGVVDLVLLPIEQYKKDGRIIKGLQKGAQSFVKTAAVETLSLGTKIAVGTTALLEQADELLSSPGTGTPHDYMTGTSSSTSITHQVNAETVSRYAEQPSDIAEGLSLGYKSLAKNVNSAVKTIYAIPMEVYERDGAQGSVKAVVKAVPIAAVLTMTGITSAVGKTLMGIRNTIDKTKKYEVEDKYKRKS